MRERHRRCYVTDHAIARYRQVDLDATHVSANEVRSKMEQHWASGVVVHRTVERGAVYTHVESSGYVIIGARNKMSQWTKECDRLVTVITLAMYRASRAVKVTWRLSGQDQERNQEVQIRSSKRRKRHHRTRRRWAIDGPDIKGIEDV